MQWQDITELNKYGNNKNARRFIADLLLLLTKKDNSLLTFSTKNIPAFLLLYASIPVPPQPFVFYWQNIPISSNQALSQKLPVSI